MVTLEQVEKLREYANISYDEAKTALENADGDILQAIIELERQGKIQPPKGGGQFQTGSAAVADNTQSNKSNKGKENQAESKHDKSAFGRNMKKLFRWLGGVIHKGNINAFVVEKDGESLMRLPLTVLVILATFAFWIVLPLIIVGLFFNFRYSFEGPDINNSKVNDAMNTVANAAEEIKNDMRSNS
ncbi:MAG: DUF4342 domain-containing protein [Anaerovoracaceae bacterium]|jgi:hypothetical protein|nr:DUF4342 domain-containing protein [Clostridiales bacterium]